jgi:hypothetical protein
MIALSTKKTRRRQREFDEAIAGDDDYDDCADMMKVSLTRSTII